MAPVFEEPHLDRIEGGGVCRIQKYVSIHPQGVPGDEHNPYTNQTDVSAWDITEYEFTIPNSTVIAGFNTTIVLPSTVCSYYHESLRRDSITEEIPALIDPQEALAAYIVVCTQYQQLSCLHPDTIANLRRHFRQEYFDLKATNSHGSGRIAEYFEYLEQQYLKWLFETQAKQEGC